MKNNQGFTITELLVAVSISAIMVSILFIVTFNYYTATVKADTSTTMALQSQTLLNQLAEELRLANAVLASSQLTDANQPSGGWQTSDEANVFIIESPAVDANQNIIFDTSTGFPYSNEYIYFIEGETLYKRVLKNEQATGSVAVTTCPESAVTTECPADRVFLDSTAADMTFTLYDSNNDVTTDQTQARSVELTISMAKKVFGEMITLGNTTRVTIRNQ